MFLSTIVSTTSLVAPAVTLLFAFICYGNMGIIESRIIQGTDIFLFSTAIAAVKQQPHASTKILGGTGVDNVV